MKEKRLSLGLLVLGVINNPHPLHDLLDNSQSFTPIKKADLTVYGRFQSNATVKTTTRLYRLLTSLALRPCLS